MSMRLLMVFAFAALVPVAAPAHAFLQRTAPTVGATVDMAPKRLRLWFSERLEGAFSRVAIVDAKGRSVAAAAMHLASGDSRELVVELEPLSPGTYHVRWRAVSVDTHVTQGSFEFTVAQ